MKVTVKFFTTLREIVGKKELMLTFPNNESVTIYLVLQKLAKLYGNDLVAYVYNSKTGAVKGFLQFLVNGKSVTDLEGLKTKLLNKDVLAIIPPVGGG